MSYLDRLLKQDATRWELTGFSEYGDPTFNTPQFLSPDDQQGVRWENKSELFIDTKTGDQSHSRAIVWSAVTEFAVGDYLYLGESSAANPESVSGADRVRYVEKVPDTKGRNFLYKAVL